jgi:SAM-dependent methyltransferase
VSERERSEFRYDRAIDPDSDSTHAKLIRLVGGGKRVLELGCATGYMSRVLSERGCEVVGIEIDPEAAKQASSFCAEVIVGDIDQMDLSEELGERRFDVVVAADLLEHLKAPESVLATLRDYLDPGGSLVASVPNIAHGSVRLALLEGSFRYTELGLLDRSHLRFYTGESLRELVERSGYVLASLDRQPLGIENSEVTYCLDRAPDGIVDFVLKDPEALTYQFILRALPIVGPSAGLIATTTRLLWEEREAAERRASELETERDRLVALAAEVDEVRERLAAASRDNERLRLSTLDMQDAVLRREEELDRVQAYADNLTRETARRDQLILSQEDALSGLRQECDRLRDLEGQLKEIHSSRLWRWGTRYRKLIAWIGSR